MSKFQTNNGIILSSFLELNLKHKSLANNSTKFKFKSLNRKKLQDKFPKAKSLNISKNIVNNDQYYYGSTLIPVLKNYKSIKKTKNN